jgi:hypothetical protein
VTKSGLACLALLSQLSAFGEGDSSFDTALKQILLASKDRFAHIQGARIENRRRDFFYEPQLYLPGATYCRIFQTTGDWIYGCDWEQANNRNGFAGLYDRLVEKVAHALGQEWNKQPGSRKSGKEIVFIADGRPTVQLIQPPRTSEIHLFILPAGASQKGLSTLPDWHAFFHP